MLLRTAPSVLALLAALCAGAAAAEEEFSMEGIFSQNRACNADGSAPQSTRVVITGDQITYTAGTCNVGARRREENKLILQVTCKQKSGKVLASYISFSRRDDKTFDMLDQAGTYKAVLHRCSEAASNASVQSPDTAR